MGNYKTIQEAQAAVTPNHYVALSQDGTYGVFEKDASGQWVASCQYAYSTAGVQFPADFYGLVQNAVPVQHNPQTIEPAQYQVQSTVTAAQQNMPPINKEPFYKRTWFVVLFLIIFPPVGIVLAWVFKKPGNKVARIVLTVVSALILVMALMPKAPSPTASDESQNKAAQTQQETKAEETKKVEPKKEVDKSVLKASLDNFNGLDPAVYTPESFAAMTSALQSAQVIYDNKDATESDVKKANSALSTASNGLKEAFDPANYAAIAYSDIARTPDDFKGQRILVSGKVLQVSESATEIDLRVATDGAYGDVVMVGYDPKLMSSRVLEDDMINIYGTSIGLYTYTSTLGASISVPGLFADQIELQ